MNELNTIIKAVEEINDKYSEWEKDYIYDKHKNEYYHISSNGSELETIKQWFNLGVK
jgi:hypothetical protein